MYVCKYAAVFRIESIKQKSTLAQMYPFIRVLCFILIQAYDVCMYVCMHALYGKESDLASSRAFKASSRAFQTFSSSRLLISSTKAVSSA